VGLAQCSIAYTVSPACVHVHIININEDKLGDKQGRAEQSRVEVEKEENKEEKEKATKKKVIAVAVHLLRSRTD
jgi:Na+-transporting methylmalonyl-CoA/oxaloacetate decarboxylase gamma subunit